MDLFGWRQLPCYVLHTFSQEVEKKQYCNINAYLVFCVFFIIIIHQVNMPLPSRHMTLVQLASMFWISEKDSKDQMT